MACPHAGPINYVSLCVYSHFITHSCFTLIQVFFSCLPFPSAEALYTHPITLGQMVCCVQCQTWASSNQVQSLMYHEVINTQHTVTRITPCSTFPDVELLCTLYRTLHCTVVTEHSLGTGCISCVYRVVVYQTCNRWIMHCRQAHASLISTQVRHSHAPKGMHKSHNAQFTLELVPMDTRWCSALHLLATCTYVRIHRLYIAQLHALTRVCVCIYIYILQIITLEAVGSFSN